MIDMFAPISLKLVSVIILNLRNTTILFYGWCKNLKVTIFFTFTYYYEVNIYCKV